MYCRSILWSCVSIHLAFFGCALGKPLSQGPSQVGRFDWVAAERELGFELPYSADRYVYIYIYIHLFIYLFMN